MNKKPNFMNLDVYNLSRDLGGIIWQIVEGWSHFQKRTIGQQYISSTDSIAANIAEGSGKGSRADMCRFAKISRGSLFEMIHWTDLATERGLITPEQQDKIARINSELAPKLNNYIKALSK